MRGARSHLSPQSQSHKYTPRQLYIQNSARSTARSLPDFAVFTSSSQQALDWQSLSRAAGYISSPKRTNTQTDAAATTTQLFLLLLFCAQFLPAAWAFLPHTFSSPPRGWRMSASTSSSGDPPPPPDKGVVTRIYQGTLPPGMSMNEAYDEWLQYTWIDGGGLSLGPPPIIRERGDLVTGKGLLREIPLVGIQENILTADRPSALTYRVMNPGLTTFQVYWHLGSVKWTKGATDADGVQVEWAISVVPWFGFGWWVSLMVRTGLWME